MSRALIYSRPQCHLCDVMEEALRPWLQAGGITAEKVDVDSNPELKARYGLRIPVFVLDGEVICEGRVDEDAVRDALNLR